MEEIQINSDLLEEIVNSYKNEDETFVIRSFINKGNQKVCDFFINHKQCKIIFYIKKNTVKIVPTGKNIEESKKIVDYIKKYGYSMKEESRQIVFKCTNEILTSLLKHIDEEFGGEIEYEVRNNIVVFKGYNGDKVTFTLYPTTSKAMIQAKPFFVFNVIIAYLSSLPQYNFEDIININNSITAEDVACTFIRKTMIEKLGEVYEYLDEALKKSISASLSLLAQNKKYEDYTGFVTGIFKALEGYLIKILTTKFNYRLEKNKTFSMFHREKGQPSEIDLNNTITEEEKVYLNKLYKLYSNKRNVYLHSTVDPSQTRIIENIEDARSLSDEILSTIKESYKVFFKIKED